MTRNPRNPGRRRAARTRRGLAAVTVALGLGAAVLPAAAHAADAELIGDTAAKAEFDYFTEDRRALERLATESKALRDSSDPVELYAYAHVQFRRLQLAAAAHAGREADDAGSACLAALDKRTAAASRDVEALALGAACAGYLAELGGLKRLTAGHRRDSNLEAARAIAPANPRLLLTAAIFDWFHGASAPAARADVRAQLTRVAGLFDQVVDSAPGAPSWGGAEAWLFVGRALEQDANLLGARNAYERSLLIAPDFAAAKRRLAHLSARR
jgi:hypothetical protein